MKEISERFRPFEDWSEGEETFFGLCVKDGKIFNPDPNWEYGFEEYLEYHISSEFDNIWRVEVATSESSMQELYYGKIPTREFFVELIKNINYSFDVEKFSRENTISREDGTVIAYIG